MMRCCYLSTLLSLLCVSAMNLYGQTKRPGIVWEHTYGGSFIDVPLAVRRATNGGFVVAGASQSSDGTVAFHHGDVSLRDYFILRVDDTGRFLWKQVLGGSGDDLAMAVQQTSDGGFIVAGSSASINGDITDHHGSADTYDIWIVKIADSGAIQWKHSFGGKADDKAYSVQQTLDGGYIVAGASASVDGDHLGSNGGFDCWILKLDPNGVLQWQRSLGGSGDDIAYSVSETTDHGYIVAASSASDNDDVSSNFGAEDYWIMKLDSIGAIQWQHSYGGSGDDVPYCVVQTHDGGYAVAGYSNSSDHDVTGNHGQEDMWVLKLTSAGNIVWQHSLGGSDIDGAFSILESPDSSLAVAGYTLSGDGDVTSHIGGYDVWFVRLGGNDGSLLEQRTFGGKGDEIAYGLAAVTDSTFMLVAASNSQDGDVSTAHGFDDYWLLEISPVHDNIVRRSPAQTSGVSAYPNPFHARTTILVGNELSEAAELYVYSATGQEARHMVIPAGRDHVVLERGDLVRGVYGYRVLAGGRFLRSGSLVIE